MGRRYAQKDTDFKLDCVRSDPYHFPNHLQVDDEMHYEDRRARSQHIDPRVRALREIPRDKSLREAVPEEMVSNIIKAGLGSAKVKPDPDVLAIQFDPNVRPQKETVRELNVDLSCCDLPARENFREPPSESSRTTSTARTGLLGKDWSWCLGGRKPLTPPDHGCVHIQKCASVPVVNAGKSHLSHQKGVTPGAFHGTTFKAGDANQRMRGGQNAIQGSAGTFPARETRPGL